MAGRWMATHFNRPDFEDLIDFNVYALCGDGCIMEGISAEAAFLAGHLKLSNLCWIYDNNHITIEGHTELAFSDDVATRFIGHGWNVTRVGDANDLEMLDRAFRTFLSTPDRPTLIIVDSHIAYGGPRKQDTSAAHGEPLGEQEIRSTKRNSGWPEDAQFYVPDRVYGHFRNGIGQRGTELRDAWFARVREYRDRYPELAEQLYRMQHRQLPAGQPDVLLLASGSEVRLCLDAYEQLTAEGIRARVVSMPSWELFDDQPPAYRDHVLPPAVPARVVVVVQDATFGWERYVGTAGHIIGMRTFGASAPLKELQRKFGFTPEHIVAAAREQLAQAR